MQCRPSSSHSEATHCTHLHHLAGGRSKGFSFWLRHLQSSPYTVRKNQGVRYHPTSILDPPGFFSLYFVENVPMEARICICDIVWQCGGFFSFFKQQHTKVIDDPSFLGRFQISPRGGQHHERLSRSRSMPSIGRCPKEKNDLVLSHGKAKNKEETNHVFVWWRVHILEIILKTLVQLI